MDNSQNLFKVFKSNPVEYNLKHVKCQLLMQVITQLRKKNWTKGKTKRRLGLSKSVVKALFKGEISSLTLDDLFTIIVKLGKDIRVKNDLDSTGINLEFVSRRKK